MKKLLGVAVIVLLALASCKDESGNIVKINLSKKVEGEALIFPVGKRGAEKAEIVKHKIGDSKFSVKLPEGVKLYSLQINGSKTEVYFVMDKDVVSIDVDMDDSFKSIVKGGELNKLYKEYESATATFFEEQTALRTEYKDAKGKELVDQFLAKKEAINNKSLDYKKKFVADNNNFVGAYVLYAQKYYFDREFMEEQYSTLNDSTKATFWGEATSQLIKAMERTEIGNKYVDVTLPDVNGKEMSISDYLNKDKYVAVYFWASWCSYCRKNNPNVVDLYEKYKDKLEIVGISLDEDKAKWQKGIQDDGITWPQMSNLVRFNSIAVDEYAVISIPYIVLLDKNGTIINKGLEIEKLEHFLRN